MKIGGVGLDWIWWALLVRVCTIIQEPFVKKNGKQNKNKKHSSTVFVCQFLTTVHVSRQTATAGVRVRDWDWGFFPNRDYLPI